MNQKKGFLPLLLIIIAAIAIGGGVYYASHRAKVSSQAEVSVNGETAATATPAQSIAQTGGTLRALLALGKNVKCTIDSGNVSGASSGTVYISGTMMRGDFTTNAQSGGTVESHMIRNGNDVLAWSGTQGAKMSLDAMTPQANANASAQSSSHVDLDKPVNYTCTDWQKDDSEFQAPSGVKFVDIAAMLKAQINVGGIPH